MNLISILDKHQQNKSAIVAFNIQNINQLESLANAVKKKQIPAIAQFSVKYFNHLNRLLDLSRIVKIYSEVGVAFYLDHCNDIDIIKKVIYTGFDGVMYDGSHYDLRKNIYETNYLYEITKPLGIVLEAELGPIKGIEDGLGSKKGSSFSLIELEFFLKSANFDLLALGIGNSHGMSQNIEDINLDLLKEAKEINEKIKLVLHGCSGLPEDIIRKSIQYGVVKLNYSTELKIATRNVLRNYLEQYKLFDELEMLNSYNKYLGQFFTNHILNYK